MTNTDVIRKLIGKINPVGETNTDNERIENLKAMCELVNELVSDIVDVSRNNQNAQEFSVKRASAKSYIFLVGLRDELNIHLI
jgi:uncharacterized protein YaaR (DUF327 family)